MVVPKSKFLELTKSRRSARKAQGTEVVRVNKVIWDKFREVAESESKVPGYVLDGVLEDFVSEKTGVSKEDLYKEESK
jgi:hypothetical protein